MRIRQSLGVLLGLVAVLVVAESAVSLLSPAVDPATGGAELSRFFTAAQLARADGYRDPGRWIAIAALMVNFALLGAVVAGRPRRLRFELAIAIRRPILGGALVGAALFASLVLALTPFSLLAHQRAANAAIATDSLGGWARDRSIALALQALGGGIAGAILVVLQRRFGERWWIGATVATVAFATLITWVQPVLITPLFGNEARLGDPRARQAVLELADRADVAVDDVFVLDASRRSRTLNAYVSGIGASRRVVLYDNLVEGLDRRELRAVVAHELGHVKGNDLWRGIAYIALVAPFGLAFLARALRPLLAGRRLAPGTAAAVAPSLAAILALAGCVEITSNRLSRAVEARADQVALELTGDPAGLVRVQVALARRNLSDLDPPGWYQALFATHPSPIERIDAAISSDPKAAASEAGPSG